MHAAKSQVCWVNNLLIDYKILNKYCYPFIKVVLFITNRVLTPVLLGKRFNK